MLTKKDKAAIRQIIQEELKDAFFRKITIERCPRGPGDPEKVIKEEDWNILDFLLGYIPKIEGALRGMQEDIDRAKNNIAGNNKRLEAIGNVLIGMEQAAKTIAMISDEVKKALPKTELIAR